MSQKETVQYSDYEKIEIRAATIISAEAFPKARIPAIKLTLDFGPLGIKRSSAQIATYYTPEALVGKQVVAVVNFPPKQIADFMSDCLVLGCVTPEGTVTLLHPERPVENGEVVR
jgi:tRNA-binding protein